MAQCINCGTDSASGFCEGCYENEQKEIEMQLNAYENRDRELAAAKTVDLTAEEMDVILAERFGFSQH